MSLAEALNADLTREHPAAAACLSGLGRRAFFPRGIPAQSADARDARYNATIGQVTDGHGSPLPLPAIAALLGELDARKSHLYSPPSGHADLRQAWAARQRRFSGGSTAPTTLPFLTHGLTQALSFAAELFSDEDSPVIVPTPRWGNYDQVWGVRRAARLVDAPLFADRAFTVEPLRQALAGVDGPATVVLNFPHNPSGFTPNHGQASALIEVVLAHPHPLVILVDDAYAGMIWDEDVPTRSLFWDLAERHDPDRHVVLRADGVTKELLFFPGRVGFLTIAADPDSKAAAAFESKLAGLARSGNGSPVGPSQAAVLHALSQPDLDDQIAQAHATLRRRYERLHAALDRVAGDVLQPYPFNSGVFALVGLGAGLDAEEARLKLLAEQDCGLVRIGAVNALRIAWCSVAEEDIDGIVDAMVRGLGR